MSIVAGVRRAWAYKATHPRTRVRVTMFDENQPRDESGRWTGSGAAGDHPRFPPGHERSGQFRPPVVNEHPVRPDILARANEKWRNEEPLTDHEAIAHALQDTDTWGSPDYVMVGDRRNAGKPHGSAIMGAGKSISEARQSASAQFPDPSKLNPRMYRRSGGEWVDGPMDDGGGWVGGSNERTGRTGHPDDAYDWNAERDLAARLAKEGF